MDRQRKKLLKVCLLVLGLGALAALFVWQGFGDVLERIVSIGPFYFGLMLLLSFFWNFCSTLAWWFIIEGDPKPVGFWKLFLVRWIGESINTITPLMNLGGEPVKMVMMHRHLKDHEAVASVIVDKTLFSAASVLHMVTGVAIGLFVFDLPGPVQWVEILLTLLLVAGVVMLVTLIRGGKALTSALGWVERLGPRISGKVRSKAADIDTELAAFHGRHRGRFWAAIAAHFAGRASRMFDLTLIGMAFGVPISPWAAYAIAAATVIVNTSFSFIPQQVGANEGGHALLFKAVGLSWADGLSSGVLRRGRTLVFSGMGYAVLTAYQALAPAAESRALSEARHAEESGS